ncbi:MAG: FecR family protein [Ferruginibacter sp.]|nr:FecR family protein [Ferruginibacter sp.]
MEENRFYILVARKLAGDIAPVELEELDLILLRNPVYKQILSQISAKISSHRHHQTIDKEKILLNLRHKIMAADPHVKAAENNGAEPEQREKSSWKKYGIPIFTAAVVLLLALGLFRFLGSSNNSGPDASARINNNISTRPGSKTQVKLPDGTVVILNADSKLTYPDNFLGATREVTLVGEAFFEVAENKNKPFIVHAGGMDIKVLGTVFNVKSYPKENSAVATLIRGSIEVTLKDRTNQKIMLKPNEKITLLSHPPLPKESGAVQKAGVTEVGPLVAIETVAADSKENIIREIGWTQNKLMFNNESFESMIITMQRWYGRQVEIRNPALKKLTFTANFTDESLMQVLLALQASSGFTIKRENNAIIIL